MLLTASPTPIPAIACSFVGAWQRERFAVEYVTVAHKME